MPVGDTMLKIRRVEDNKWTSRNLLNVPSTTLRAPTEEEAAVQLKLGMCTCTYYIFVLSG